MVSVFFEDIEEIKIATNSFYESWLDKVATIESKQLGEISIILTSDDYLLTINQKYLQHDYYTDIITFDYSEETVINGDLFISIDRVKENALANTVSFENELNRVIVHGYLHLCGYKDKSESEEKMMRKKENQMLMLL